MILPSTSPSCSYHHHRNQQKTCFKPNSIVHDFKQLIYQKYKIARLACHTCTCMSHDVEHVCMYVFVCLCVLALKRAVKSTNHKRSPALATRDSFANLSSSSCGCSTLCQDDVQHILEASTLQSVHDLEIFLTSILHTS